MAKSDAEFKFTLGIDANDADNTITKISKNIELATSKKHKISIDADTSKATKSVADLDKSVKNIEDKKSDPYIFSKARSYAFEDRIYSSVNQIRMLEELCKAYDIKLFWNSWSGVDQKIYSDLKFNNFCPFYDYSFREEEVYLTIPEKFKKYWDSARDVNHPGIKYMSNVAKMFFTRWNKVYENF
jgi:hypothetical protein